LTIVLEGRVVTPFQVVSPGYVTVKDSKIQHVGSTKPRNEEILSFRDCYVCPGLIDVHTHGAGGHDIMDGKVETICALSTFFPMFGVTAFLPTLSTTSQGQAVKVAKAVNKAEKENDSGSNILGLHLEGPYINPTMKGAQNPEYVRPPSIPELREIMEKVNLRLVTMAPEVEEALQVAMWLGTRQVVVSAGHSSATYQQMLKGINAGFRHVTHLYNAMKGFHHREPGIMGAALLDSRISFEIIPDGIHLHKVAYELALKLKQPAKTVLVSDSLPTTGLGDGEYDCGGRSIVLKNGVARLESGVLAGSNITLNEGVGILSGLGVRELREIIHMASYSPACLLGIQGRKGSLSPGMDADIAVFDSNFNPRLTMVGGNITYIEEA
jgi:N-acetylglucosamine-6-phosphate deacetylase